MNRLVYRSLASLAKGPQSFKDFAKHLAKNTCLSPQTNTSTVAIVPKGKNYQIQVREPMTFSKVLERSSVLQETANDDIDSKLDQINSWDEAMEVIIRAEQLDSKSSKNELMNKPGIRPFFNLASIVNENPTLQRLVDLGVDISAWERNGDIDTALVLDFQHDVIPRIYFLLDLGIHPDDLGRIFSRNPKLFQQDMEDLKKRIDYLSWRKFGAAKIRGIIDETNSAWLNEDVLTIDSKLGFLQNLFKLKSHEVIHVTSVCPQLILWNGLPAQVINNNVALRDNMGFTDFELVQMLKKAPKLFMVSDTDTIQDTFDLLHNEVGYSHELLASMPETLNGDLYAIKNRVAFLRRLGRDQFDPTLPNYVSPKSLGLSTDEIFSVKVAKASLSLFNKYVLTM